jgi:hypothetical protein
MALLSGAAAVPLMAVVAEASRPALITAADFLVVVLVGASWAAMVEAALWAAARVLARKPLAAEEEPEEEVSPVVLRARGAAAGSEERAVADSGEANRAA